MATYYTGTSNYPGNYDVVPSGTGVTTTPYVLDEIRNGQGIITQSGNPIVAVQLNGVYTIIQAIEQTLGTNPNGLYTNVADRISALESTGSFVKITGSTMTGDLTMSGSSINTNLMSGSGVVWTVESGLSIVSNEAFSIQNDGPVDINALSNYTLSLSGNSVAIYGYNISNNAENLISLIGPNGIKTSGSIAPLVSGVDTLGLPTKFYSGIYANDLNTYQIVTSQVTADYVNAGTGSFHAISGLSPIEFLSDLNLTTGVSLTTAESGVSNLGTSNSPFNYLYGNGIVGNDDIYIDNAASNGGIIGLYSKDDVEINSSIGDIIIGAALDANISADNINLETTGYTGTIGIRGVLAPIVSSGTYDIGTTGLYFKDIYVNNIYSPSLASSGMALTTFVSKTGSDMTGELVMSGSNITISGGSIVLSSGAGVANQDSGINNLGSVALPFSGVYTDSINGNPITRLTFNESLAGATNGINKQYYFSITPNSNSAMVFVSGLLISTSAYTITGSGLLFSTLAPGQSPISTYGHI